MAVSAILIGVTIALAFYQWIYGVVWRAWKFMRREFLANPFPLVTTTTSIHATHQQQQVPTVTVGVGKGGGPLPSAPSSSSIQSVCMPL